MEESSRRESSPKKDKTIINQKIRGDTKSVDYEYSINDLNNFVGSDRKLVINDNQEFWVHDAILNKNSKFFKDNLSGEKKNIKDEKVSLKNNVIYTKSLVYIPNPDYMFDLLTWVYSKDAKRLSLAADEPESFLCIMNLGIFLEMNDDFFKTLLENCEIKLDEELFNHNLWSRFSFTFQVLINLLNLMPKDFYYLKLIALLYWLKEDNSQKISETQETIKERDFELLTSKDYFQVKKFISQNKMLTHITVIELALIRSKFPSHFPVLDTTCLIEKYVINSTLRIICKVCKRASNNIQDFIKNDCEIKAYHPRSLINLHRHLNVNCEHFECKKKIIIYEYPCCHKGSHVDGCMFNDGKHLLQFEVNSTITNAEQKI